MDFLKKFFKEISVFGIVIVVFLGLFVYRQFTFKDFTTIDTTKLTQMVEQKEDFVVVLGDSQNPSMFQYQETMQKYTTKNRDEKLYFADTNNQKTVSKYMQDTFHLEVTFPTTIVVEDGKVKNHKEGALTYYALVDFIKENK